MTEKKPAKTVLSRDQILGANDLKKVKVDVPEWGGAVYIRTLTGDERDAYEGYILDEKNKEKSVRAYLAALCIVDEQGTRLFNHSDMKALGDKSASALERIVNEAMRLNAFSSKDIDDLEKN